MLLTVLPKVKGCSISIMSSLLGQIRDKGTDQVHPFLFGAQRGMERSLLGITIMDMKNFKWIKQTKADDIIRESISRNGIEKDTGENSI